ncbi:MAG: alternative ribosome rescue aminoacyl-tRNA hydrolase ArfB [Thermodesulfobacteriota bacterium]|nr:alternative ribosome rescue aminoacyl-tRNA hydrolase ArfB [Thermodesulfobacteriota bacterium]
MIPVNSDIFVDENELTLNFVRSSGPGGQNVNKVASAVQLRFDVRRSPSLPEDVRQRLLRQAGNRINAEGVLVIEARRHREQGKNREDAVNRLVGIIRAAATRPKKRKKTRPSRAVKQRMIDKKVHRGKVKQLRKRLD